MIVLVVLIVTVLFTSGICSMIEAAILSLPLMKARLLREAKRKGADDLMIVKENIHSAIATIVIINNAINIIGSIFVGQMVTSIFGSEWLGIASAVLTLFIIVVSEVIPKTIGEHHKVPISLASAILVRFFMLLLKPFVSAIEFFTRKLRGSKTLPKVTEEEIKMMLRLGKMEGTVEVDEEVLCNRIFKLNDLKAVQMMKPIENVYGLPSEKKLIEIKDEIINSRYSRLVVYGDEKTKIVGICQQRILLKELANDNENALVRDFMVTPIFIKEHERADTLLEKFQAYHQHLFIVRNSKDENIGVISMEDVLEELFGEIYDEKDTLAYKKKQKTDLI
ncbi:MAG: CNNM domain-containing protein [Candidatus Omnitrophota bacterium]